VIIGSLELKRRITVEEHIKAKVAKATVILLGNVGQGVLVSGNLIVTAAHCIDFKCEGEMVLGDYYIEEILTTLGTLKVRPLAVEPVKDIAVLGSLDDQTFPGEAERFEEFCTATEPVVVGQGDYDLFQELPVYIYNGHRGMWIKGSAHLWAEDEPMLWLESDEQIEGGTSGGPIVDESGTLVGIVSNMSINGDNGRKCTGNFPRPHLTLPVWVCSRILGE
jgi:CBS domain-containing protein